jgi:hypothetical protein
VRPVRGREACGAKRPAPGVRREACGAGGKRAPTLAEANRPCREGYLPRPDPEQLPPG